MAAEEIGVFKRPDLLCGDRSKRSWFHKDINHTTKECITLKDEIEKLIRCGYLKDYVNDRRIRLQNDRPKVEPPYEISMIFNGPYFAGQTRWA